MSEVTSWPCSESGNLLLSAFRVALPEVGLVGLLVKEFRSVFVVIPIYAAVYIAFMGCKFVRNEVMMRPHTGARFATSAFALHLL